MITRPTTDALIGDCCRELTEAILPALTDETLRLRLVMTETVLRNAAVRAAHEIAWMLEETSALMAYAAEVAVTARKRAAARRDGRSGGGPGRTACTSPMSPTATNGPGRLSRRRWRQRRKPGQRISSRRRENCCVTGSRPRRK